MILARNLSATPTVDGKHWNMACRQEQDIIHTDAYAQDPLPFQRTTQLGSRTGPPYPWRPGVAVYGSSDAMFPSKNSFDLAVDTTQYPAQLTVSGAQPVNVAAAIQPPIVPLQASTANTGGSIPGGASFWVAISCNGVIGPVSTYFVPVVIPAGTNTNTFTVSGIHWRNAAAEASPAAFVGSCSINMRLATSGYTTSAPDTYGNPTSFTFTSIPIDGLGLPDVNASEFLIEETDIWHGGVWADTIASVAGAVLTFNVPGSGFGTSGSGQFAGYVLSLYYRPGLSPGTPQPALNLTVSSNTVNALTMAATGFLAGDVVVMRQKTGSVTANGFGDPNWNNCYALSQYGSPGLAINAEIGRLAFILSGTGAGQPPISVASNTHTNFVLQQNWYIQPDSTSVIIIIDSTVAYSYYTNTFSNPSSSAEVPVVRTPAITAGFQTLLVQVATSDQNGNTMPMQYQPFREVYVPPQNVGGSGYYTITPAAGVAIVNPSNGDTQVVTLPNDGSLLTITIGGSPPSAGFDVDLYVRTPATGSWQTPAFTGGTNGFASDVAAGTRYTSSNTANVQDLLPFTFHGAGTTVTLGQPAIGIAII